MSENNNNSNNTTVESLQNALSHFEQPEVLSVARNPMRPQPQQELQEDETELAEEDTELDLESLESTETEATEEEEPEVEEDEEESSSSFNEQFKEAFGMEPTEAVELVSELQNFRSEMLLMREWGVDPKEYDSRVTAVKEFYNGLPEGKREQFNTPEGVKAIWNHLEKSAPADNKKTKRTRGTLSKAKGRQQPEMLKRSDIIAMDDATYRKNYRKINEAFAQNRIIEDI
jgi:hypothetical protein